FHGVEIAQNFSGVLMPEEYLSIRRSNENALVAPDVGATFSNSADAISTEKIPATSSVMFDLTCGERAQSKPEGADLNSGRTEAILKPAPRKGRNHKEHNTQYGAAGHCCWNAQGGVRAQLDYYQDEK